MALPEYAGQGAEAELEVAGGEGSGAQESGTESDADLEEDMEAALGDDSLGALAKVPHILAHLYLQSHSTLHLPSAVRAGLLKTFTDRGLWEI